MLEAFPLPPQALARTILILVAMDVEEAAILGERSWNSVEISAPLQLRASTLPVGPHAVAVVKTGVGTVNAGVALALFAAQTPPSAVILLGVGGALCPDLRAGDSVVATHVVQHDCLISGDEGSQLMAPGQLHLSVPADERHDPRMATDVGLTRHLVTTMGATPRPGVVLSGNEFVGAGARKRALREAHAGALLVDMESAGVAQVARRMQVPFAVIKTVADAASPNTSISEDYLTWILASTRTAEHIIATVLASLEVETGR